MWKNKRVLVTGGASFISSHLVEKLVKLGADVLVADNLSSGKKENLNDVSPQITLHVGDLRDRSFADFVMKNVDIIFHMAACHGGRGYIATHPADCSSNMVLDGIVFDAANKAGVERVCFASSACVYPKSLQSRERNLGDNRILLSEDMANPFVESKAFADEEYGWAKLMGEMVLKAYHKQYGLKGVSCRIFTAYGPRENETHAVIALLAKAFVQMDPYEVWGTGEQDRNFTYVEDTVEGLIRATARIEDVSPINIGTSEHIKIKDVVSKIFEYTGFRPKKVFFDTSKPEGVFSRAADLTRVRKLLNWEPEVSFDDGLKRTIEWYRSITDKNEVSKRLHTLLFER
jgi:nucleoside-diphosphate-sugar epimerase